LRRQQLEPEALITTVTEGYDLGARSLPAFLAPRVSSVSMGGECGLASLDAELLGPGEESGVIS
jgi:hypothetical protein